MIRSQNPGQLEPLPKLSRSQRELAVNARLEAPELLAETVRASVDVENPAAMPSVGHESPFIGEAPVRMAAAPRPSPPTTVLAPPKVESTILTRESQPASATPRPAAWLGFPNPRMSDDGTRLDSAPPDGGSFGLSVP